MAYYQEVAAGVRHLKDALGAIEAQIGSVKDAHQAASGSARSSQNAPTLVLNNQTFGGPSQVGANYREITTSLGRLAETMGVLEAQLKSARDAHQTSPGGQGAASSSQNAPSLVLNNATFGGPSQVGPDGRPRFGK